MKNIKTPLLDNASRILIHLSCSDLSPAEIQFWNRLRHELRTRQHELFLLGFFPYKKSMDVPYLRMKYSLDSFRYFSHDEKWGSYYASNPGFDEEGILARERIWKGPERDKTQQKRRRQAIGIFADFYANILNSVKPVLSVVWNGTHSQSLIFIELCKRCGCPVVYIERGPFAQTIFLDKKGVLCNSEIAGNIVYSWKDKDEKAYWYGVMERVKSSYREKSATWWEQPETIGVKRLKEKLNIPEGKKVLMFAGQVDNDAQSFMCSPNFQNNYEAFEWFCSSLPVNKDIFILGKHHPKSNLPIGDFQKVLADRGAWVSDASLEDCLALSDSVVAVNSTVLYEALLMDKPVLALGRSYLSGKDIAYEVKDLKTGSSSISQWMSAKDISDRLERWLDFGAFFLSRSLYSIQPEEKAYGQNGASIMADRLIEMCSGKGAVDYGGLNLSCYNLGLLFMEASRNKGKLPYHMVESIFEWDIIVKTWRAIKKALKI